jgi:hypothetical protein
VLGKHYCPKQILEWSRTGWLEQFAVDESSNDSPRQCGRCSAKMRQPV